MRAFIVIPTFNERGNVGVLAERLFGLGLPLDLVFVDDASPDGTGELLDRLAAGDERLHVLHRSGQRRLGTAYIAGFNYALGFSPDLVFTMDADLSHDPASIPGMLAAAERYDLVIGSRYTPGGRTTDFRLHRLLLSRCANWLVRAVLGMDTRDCTSGFRCYRAGVLKGVALDRIFSDGYSFLIELLYRARALGVSAGEVPINFKDRAEGVSKISRAEIFRSLYTVFRLGRCRLTGRTI